MEFLLPCHKLWRPQAASEQRSAHRGKDTSHGGPLRIAAFRAWVVVSGITGNSIAEIAAEHIIVFGAHVPPKTHRLHSRSFVWPLL